MKNLITLLVLTIGMSISSQAQTTGSMSMSVTSHPDGNAFSPKHVLAIWVEDGDGLFVKTLKLQADKRKQYLYTWNSSSSGNTTDATSGATLNSHQTHSVNWDCTDVNGTLVNDGNYAIRVEYTSEHAQGPITKIDFTKADTEFTFQPEDETYFKDMDLTYSPESTGLDFKNSISYDLETYPNPSIDFLNIKLSIPNKESLSVKVYQADMKLVKVLWDKELDEGDHVLVWENDNSNGKKVSSGIYYLIVSGTNVYSSRQIVVQ